MPARPQAPPCSPRRAPAARPSPGPPLPPHSGPSLCPLRVPHPFSPPTNCPSASSAAPFPLLPSPQPLRPRSPPALTRRDPSGSVPSRPTAPQPATALPLLKPKPRLRAAIGYCPSRSGMLTAAPTLIGRKRCHSARKGRRGTGGPAALRYGQALQHCRTLASPAVLGTHPVPTRIAGRLPRALRERLCSATFQR